MTNSTGQARDPRTGRWTVDTSNTQLSAAGRFETQRELDLAIQGANQADLAYGSVPRYAPAADELAQGYGPVMHRTPGLVPPDETASTVYASHAQSALTRAAARSAGAFDPTPYLTGADDGLSAEARAGAIAKQQAPAPVRRVSDGR